MSDGVFTATPVRRRNHSLMHGRITIGFARATRCVPGGGATQSTRAAAIRTTVTTGKVSSAVQLCLLPGRKLLLLRCFPPPLLLPVKDRNVPRRPWTSTLD